MTEYIHTQEELEELAASPGMRVAVLCNQALRRQRVLDDREHRRQGLLNQLETVNATRQSLLDQLAANI